MSITSNSQLYDRLLRRMEAAEYVRTKYGFPCSKQWLAKLATVGGGPRYRKAGKFPVYAVSDLDEWASARLSPKMEATGILAPNTSTKNAG